MIRTANPALSGDALVAAGRFHGTDAMSVTGTSGKAFVLGALVMIVALAVWSVHGTMPGMLPIATWGGAIVGFILAMITIFNKTWAPVTAPLYAVAEGAFLGGISTIFEASYPGIAIQAVGLTAAVFLVMLGAYVTRVIEVTPGLRSGILVATGGIALFYVVSFVLRLFGVSIPYVHGSGIIGIGFSLLVVGVAAFNLLLDFDRIEHAARRGAPKHMEWYAAFGLLVTLVWLYLEILRLLAKLQRRD